MYMNVSVHDMCVNMQINVSAHNVFILMYLYMIQGGVES